MRLGVSAVQHDMKREETVEEVEKNTEWERHTPKPPVSIRPTGKTSYTPPYLSWIEGPPPKRNAGSSSLPGGAKNAVISMDCGVFLLEVQPAKTDQEENYDCINSEIAS